jgi:rare lipoprotein A
VRPFAAALAVAIVTMATVAPLAGCTRTLAPADSVSGSRARPSAVESPAGPPQGGDRVEVQRGYASWYGASLAGHRTASGERFDPTQMTAAHRSLPLGTWVEVRRADGAGGAVRVRINDRGPFGHSDRIIDLARAAADKLGIRKSGLALVEIHVVAGP